MPKNPLSFFTREEVEFFGKPFFTGYRWINPFIDNDKKVLLTRSRCAYFGYPVNDDEEPCAYRYTQNGPAERKYVPLYDRTNFDIPVAELYYKEIYPIKEHPKKMERSEW